MSRLSRREICQFAMAVLCFGAVVTAHQLQSAWNLQPCTMCILQRYAFIVIGVGMSLNGIWMEPLLRGLAGLSALVGIGASVRIQYAISVHSVSCGRDQLAGYLNGLPWVENYPSLFEATGICGDPVPPVLGVPFHVWSGAIFVASLVLLWLSRGARGRRRTQAQSAG